MRSLKITMQALALFLCILYAASPGNAEPKVLVLGGNDLVSSQTAIDMRTLWTTVVNEGNWNGWDNGRIKAISTAVACTDMGKLDDCYVLKRHLAYEKYFYAFIDFTIRDPYVLKGFLDIGRYTGKYIYISTDSVYEVCKQPPHEGPLREEDAVRPTDAKERESLAAKDSYGDRKLACEETLIKECKDKRIHWLNLRLPDVIGPRDNTNRFWTYLIWLRFGDLIGKHISLPPHLAGRKMSLVHSEDVGSLILRLVKMNPYPHFKQTYNLAFRETVTLEELINLMAKALGIKEVKYDQEDNAGTYLYPSVTRGPVNITKAENNLGWNPMPLTEAVEKTVQFYEFAMRAPEFRRPRNTLIDQLIPKEKKEAFKKKFKKIYGIDYKEIHVIDEL